MTTTQDFNPGDKVRIVPTDASGFLKCLWWPKGVVTGTVQKVFKNGTVAVAVDQLRNTSEDGLKTLHFKGSDLEGA